MSRAPPYFSISLSLLFLKHKIFVFVHTLSLHPIFPVILVCVLLPLCVPSLILRDLISHADI